MPKISVIMPTMGRPNLYQPAQCVQMFFEMTRGHDVEAVCVVECHEPTAETLCKTGARVFFRPTHEGGIRGWNEGAWHATGDIFVLGADDLFWQPGWLDEALEAWDKLPDHCGVVGLNDCHRRDGWAFATHFMMTRSFALLNMGGVFLPPVYYHYNCDLEVGTRARKAGQYIWAMKARADHRHFLYDKRRYDSVYDSVGYQIYANDTALYDMRNAAGFPNTWNPMLGTTWEQLQESEV